MTVRTRVSLHMSVLLSTDLIDGCYHNKGNPRKLSDEGTLWKTFDKLQLGQLLFTSRQTQEREHLDHVDLNLSSGHQGLSIAISSGKMGIHVKHSGCKRCLGITWMGFVLWCPFSILPTDHLV